MSQTKGILLAGGKGTRLYPLTAIVSKQLQPVYDKPMVYYPLTTLMVAGIRDILLISSPSDIPHFRKLLGDGSQWGIDISYEVQNEPRGIAEALLIAESFLKDDPAVLVLGDNLIYGRLDFLRDAILANGNGATVFAYEVHDPSSYGVVEFDDKRQAISLEEKPQHPKSRWAVPGLYVYGPRVAERARSLKPSARGELEITDLNRLYLDSGELQVEAMGRGIAWLDTGTAQNLMEASSFVQTLQARQGLFIGSPDEAALQMKYVAPAEFIGNLERIPPSPYRDTLLRIAESFQAGEA